MTNKISIAVHGGAGTISKKLLTAEKENAYLTGLKLAVEAGHKILKAGGSSLDAVEAAVIILENNTLFNAGKGSVFTNEGLHEMDASIMEGKNLMAGAVAGVRNIKNPVVLSRKVMEQTEHVFLCGLGAEELARKCNLEFMPPDYFFDSFRHDQWIAIRDTETTQLDHSDKKFGTVGAVALDLTGTVAAATSTGGMTNKRYNRIGDTPIIGAGTYANNKTCAVSCTGHGEFFIRSVIAYDVSCLMEYKGYSLKDACNEVVKNKLVTIGGEGGLIAVDAVGNLDLCFNSEGMYRGYKQNDGETICSIY